MRLALLLSAIVACAALGAARPPDVRAQESHVQEAQADGSYAPGHGQLHGHPPEHAQLHEDFYSRLEVPDAPPGASLGQKSCCNNRDCHPVQARFNGSEWEFLSPTGWRRVPPETMLDVRSPDTQAHACVSLATRKIRCFEKPDFGT